MIDTDATKGEPTAVEYRGKVRARDRDTSWEAAAAQTNTKTAALQQRIYLSLRDHGPATHEELLIRLGGTATPSGIRTRSHELEVAGWVREERTPDPSDPSSTPRYLTVKRPTLSGHPSTVWRAVLDSEPAPPPREPEAPAPKPAKHDHARGLAAARALAGWELGSESWASLLIEAYLNPEAAEARLREEMED